MRGLIFSVLISLVWWAGPSAALAQPLEGKVGVYSFPDSEWWEQWMRFQANIKADPQFDFEWYLNGELGSEQQLITGARRNRIQIISISSQGMTSLVPEIGVLMSPYIFDSLDEADFVLDNYLTGPISDLFRAQGLEPLVFNEVGWQVLYSVNEPVIVPADLSGKTIRISPSIILQSFVESIGADYAALELGDLIPGLQTGVVNGGLTNVVFVHNALDGQVCCVTRLQGIYETGVIFAAKRWFDRATDAQQDAMVAAYDSLAMQRPRVRAYVDSVIAESQDRGVRYINLTPEQRRLWKEASAGALRRILDSTGAEGARLYDLVQEGKAAFAGRTQEN